MEPEPMSSEGGFCAPIPAASDLRPPLDEARLGRAAEAIKGWQWTLELSDVERLDLARIVVTEYQRIRLIDQIGTLSAPRGAVKFVTPPPGGYKPPTRWQRAKWANERRRAKIAAPYRRLAAARKRLSDARAVWHGTKDAYSDAEIEKLTEDCY